MNAGKGESVDRKELITERCFEKTLGPMGHIVEFSDFFEESLWFQAWLSLIKTIVLARLYDFL